MLLKPISSQYETYLQDESRLSGHADRSAFPTNTDELLEVLDIAKERKLLITVQGGRTGIVGGAVPVGGLIVNLSLMNRLLGIKTSGDYNKDKYENQNVTESKLSHFGFFVRLVWVQSNG
ncbi:FAD-binding protein [Lachnospiraceae bacterium ZAX-1]